MRQPIEMGKSEMLFEEEKIALFALGSMVEAGMQVREALKERGLPCTLVNARFAKPIDGEMIRYLSHHHQTIVTMEENVASGGLGEKVRTLVEEERLPARVLSIHVPDEYVEHGNVAILKKEIGIDVDSILNRILEEIGIG